MQGWREDGAPFGKRRNGKAGSWASVASSLYGLIIIVLSYGRLVLLVVFAGILGLRVHGLASHRLARLDRILGAVLNVP